MIQSRAFYLDFTNTVTESSISNQPVLPTWTDQGALAPAGHVRRECAAYLRQIHVVRRIQLSAGIRVDSTHEGSTFVRLGTRETRQLLSFSKIGPLAARWLQVTRFSEVTSVSSLSMPKGDRVDSSSTLQYNFCRWFLKGWGVRVDRLSRTNNLE